MKWIAVFRRTARNLERNVGRIGFTLLMLGIPSTVFAALGGNEASVQSDQAHMQAAIRSTRGATYTVHELQAQTGVVVREYVSPAGTVFGVAWEGPWLPDMRQLLGSYFEQYEQAMQAQGGGRVGRRPIHVEVPGLVLNSSGHPRSFQGHAYVPEMLPKGTKAEEIR